MSLTKLFRYSLYFVVITILVVLLYNYQIKGRDSDMAGVYWIGQNGNVYVKDGGGVQDWGAARRPAPLRNAGVTEAVAKAIGSGYERIADPNTGGSRGGGGNRGPAINTSSYGGGGGAGVAAAGPVAPSQAQVDPLLQSLASLDEVLSNKNRQSREEYGRAIRGYNEQDELDRRNRDQNIFQNEDTYTSNNQRALLNAANASTGLRGVLSSLGALAGSGKDIVQRLVGLAANEDTGAARDTFETNATSVNSAWEQAEREQRQRREDAEAILENNMQNNRANVLTSRQSIFEKLAGLYGDELPEGREYAAKAGALAAPIAATTRAEVAPYAKASSLFSPAALQEYLAGTQNLNVSTAGGAEQPAINSPIYSANRKKDQLAGVA